MNRIIISTTMFACLWMSSCKPEPLDIKVSQRTRDLAISSVAIDEHTVFVSAGYSVNSMANLLDTSRGKKPVEISKDLLVDSGLVILQTPGRDADTLHKTASGLYGSSDLHLKAGADYTLFVQDLKTGKKATANTRFFSMQTADTLLPVVERRMRDTIVHLRTCISNVRQNDYYFIHYTTPSAARTGIIPWSMSISVLQSFAPKRIELIKGAEAVNGRISKDIILSVKGNDTLYAQFSRIDEAYYNYLAAYKRSGNILSQITGEPVNLPSNLSAGVGFFALYLPQREVYPLNRY